MAENGKGNVVAAFLFFLCLSAGLQAAPAFRSSEKLKTAMNRLMELRLTDARQLILSGTEAEKDNLAWVYAANYADFLELLSSDNLADYRRLHERRSQRLDKISDLSSSDPWKKWSQAELRLQWGILEAYYGDNAQAALDIREAYLRIKENTNSHPAFVPNQKSLGLLEALAGSIPAKYSFITNILGLRGDIGSGLKKLDKFIADQATAADFPWLLTEARVERVYLSLHLQKDKDEAWQRCESWTRDYKSNLLQAFVRGNIAMNTGRNAEAIAVLTARPAGNTGVRLHYFHYMLGNCLMRNLDTNAAIHFKRFIVYQKNGQYVAAAYRNLAWIAALRSNQQDYDNFLFMAARTGSDRNDEDQQAKLEGQRKATVNKLLLQARLLYDGGQYSRAQILLNAVGESHFSTAAGKTEYCYRKARVLQSLGQTDDALSMYAKAIVWGRDLELYFAANSALQCGIISEEKGNKKQAAAYYKMARDGFPRNKEFRNSIEQKARAGLQRVSG